jgi:hypothetical protein
MTLMAVNVDGRQPPHPVFIFEMAGLLALLSLVFSSSHYVPDDVA